MKKYHIDRNTQVYILKNNKKIYISKNKLLSGKLPKNVNKYLYKYLYIKSTNHKPDLKLKLKNFLKKYKFIKNIINNNIETNKSYYRPTIPFDQLNIYFTLPDNIYVITPDMNIYYQNTKYNNINNAIIESYNHISDTHIDLSLEVNNNTPYNIYIINLSHRTDRKEIIVNNSIYNSLFNLKFFNAVKCAKGWIGCALSHLTLIKYAKQNNLPYIIVAEDDNIFNNSYTSNQLKDIINQLTINLDKWKIFNGNPSLSSLPNDSYIEKYKLFNNMININWGQCTNFIIYNKSVYDLMLSYDFNEDIDLYISKTIIQSSILPFITHQSTSFSDISQIDTNYNDILNNSELKLTSIDFIIQQYIGIYGIFIGKYIKFIDDFINNVDYYFMPQYEKIYYILTDSDDIINKYTSISNTKFIFKKQHLIGWPYETLYRFKYFLDFFINDNVKYLFFFNSNIQFIRPIYNLSLQKDYTFVSHSGYFSLPYEHCSYEKNNNSIAYVGKHHHVNYIGGGIYGGKRDKFIKLSRELSTNIGIDESKQYIAVWHDESHLNHYYNIILKGNSNQIELLPPSFHIPSEKIDFYNTLYDKILAIYIVKDLVSK